MREFVLGEGYSSLSAVWRAIFPETHEAESLANRLITPLSMAKVFHGLNSPAFPTKDWRSNPFWARYVDYSFEEVYAVCQAVLSGARPRG